MRSIFILLAVLFTILIADRSVEVQANLNSPLKKSTPSPALTCWTCPEKSSNKECNKYAPDINCHDNLTVCTTVHKFHHGKGDSVSVIKKCSTTQQCNETTVGCQKTQNYSVCISCCNTDYCNEEVSYNNTMAYRLSSLVYSTATSIYNQPWNLYLTVLISLVLVFKIQTG
ncbi:hypothetical protein SNE40_022709 [Patella caerulea]|uniref:Uncharacterized protein n=1 Tax=Patella caerulea TaxID=87958 RepID=A0AAN8G8R9_PATCE